MMVKFTFNSADRDAVNRLVLPTGLPITGDVPAEKDVIEEDTIGVLVARHAAWQILIRFVEHGLVPISVEPTPNLEAEITAEVGGSLTVKLNGTKVGNKVAAEVFRVINSSNKPGDGGEWT